MNPPPLNSQRGRSSKGSVPFLKHSFALLQFPPQPSLLPHLPQRPRHIPLRPHPQALRHPRIAHSRPPADQTRQHRFLIQPEASPSPAIPSTRVPPSPGVPPQPHRAPAPPPRADFPFDAFIKVLQCFLDLYREFALHEGLRTERRGLRSFQGRTVAFSLSWRVVPPWMSHGVMDCLGSFSRQ
jgi:hypothetical protein